MGINFTNTGFKGCHSKIVLDDYVANDPTASYQFRNKVMDASGNGVYEANFVITLSDGRELVKVYNRGKSTFFPDNWDEALILDEVGHAIANNYGRFQGASIIEYYGFLGMDSRNSFFRKKIKNMKYLFNTSEIVYPDKTTYSYPHIEIEHTELYGFYIESEISHLSGNIEYVKEIVETLRSLLAGEISYYAGFGYEVYMIKCTSQEAKVINIFEDDKVEAIIPTPEVYELMRDWYDYLLKWNENSVSD